MFVTQSPKDMDERMDLGFSMKPAYTLNEHVGYRKMLVKPRGATSNQ